LPKEVYEKVEIHDASQTTSLNGMPL
jgi:hypothetical protein